MAPPSPLAIATRAVTRLVKEQASYRSELHEQLAHIAKLEQSSATADEDDGNSEYMIRQVVRHFPFCPDRNVLVAGQIIGAD